jgi:hypothetical protein
MAPTMPDTGGVTPRIGGPVNPNQAAASPIRAAIAAVITTPSFIGCDFGEVVRPSLLHLRLPTYRNQEARNRENDERHQRVVI